MNVNAAAYNLNKVSVMEQLFRSLTILLPSLIVVSGLQIQYAKADSLTEKPVLSDQHQTLIQAVKILSKEKATTKKKQLPFYAPHNQNH